MGRRGQPIFLGKAVVRKVETGAKGWLACQAVRAGRLSPNLYCKMVFMGAESHSDSRGRENCA